MYSRFQKRIKEGLLRADRYRERRQGTRFTRLSTNTYAFDDAAKAFDDFAHNPGNMLKVVFDFSKISK